MPADNITVSSWTPAGRKDAEVFKTPSGNECIIRDLELDDVMDLGILDKLDTLSGMVQTEHIDRVSGKKKKGKQVSEKDDKKAVLDMFKDKEKRKDISEVLDLIVGACVVEPKLHDPWVNDPNAATEDNPQGRRKLEKNERNPDLAYLDYVNFMDKLAIFHEAFGGMERLQQFREEANEAVGDMEPKSKSAV